ncbi:MAG TPA: signal peptide peptidase SppA [Firmicutes bacterium]|nr:signal peptide peptidase SppA [Bacillota bacterium]
MENSNSSPKQSNTARYLVIFLVIFIGIIALFSCIMVFMMSASLSALSTQSYFLDKFTVNPEQADIGVVKIEGPIYKVDRVLKNLDRFNESKKMKAVVVIIDSPGGAVVPSHKVYKKLKNISKTKDIYVCMENVCASGGYYIAVAGKEVWTSPGTITGSIGVIAQFMKTKELLDKIGVDVTVVKSGKFKDIGSPQRDMTEAERELIQDLIDDTYSDFFNIVKAERLLRILDKLKETNPNATEEDAFNLLKEQTDGRIFSGNQAVRMGFADKIGDYDELIEYLKKKYNIEKPKISRPKKKPDFFRFVEETEEMLDYRLYGIRSEILLKYSVL